MKIKPISQLFLFQSFSTKNRNIILDYLTNVERIQSNAVDMDSILEPFNIIQRRFKFISKNNVIEALSNGKIILIYNESFIIPSFIHPWLIQIGNEIISVANLGNHARISSVNEKILEIDSKKLFANLQSALVARSIYNHENKILMNSTITKNLTQTYTKMLMRVMDRLYSINLSPIQADQASYIIGKFFQIYLMEKTDNEATRANAFNCCKNETPREIIDRIEDEIEIDYNSFPNFFNNLSDSIEKLNMLTIRKIIETWVSMYGESTMLSIEHFTSFVSTVFSANISGGMNNETVINNLASRNIQAAFLEFFRLIK